MYCHEPKVREGSLDHRIDLLLAVEPFKKGFHFDIEPSGARRYVVHFFAAIWPGHHSHRSCCPVPPCAHCDLAQPAAPGREKRGMPGEKKTPREQRCLCFFLVV